MIFDLLMAGVEPVSSGCTKVTTTAQKHDLSLCVFLFVRVSKLASMNYRG